MVLMNVVIEMGLALSMRLNTEIKVTFGYNFALDRLGLRADDECSI